MQTERCKSKHCMVSRKAHKFTEIYRAKLKKRNVEHDKNNTRSIFAMRNSRKWDAHNCQTKKLLAICNDLVAYMKRAHNRNFVNGSKIQQQRQKARKEIAKMLYILKWWQNLQWFFKLLYQATLYFLAPQIFILLCIFCNAQLRLFSFTSRRFCDISIYSVLFCAIASFCTSLCVFIYVLCISFSFWI